MARASRARCAGSAVARPSGIVEPPVTKCYGASRHGAVPYGNVCHAIPFETDMGDKKSFREPRQRGFEDDYYQPSFPPPAREQRQSRPMAPQAGPTVDATVKFFNADKGFGFVATADGADAFLHIRPLEAAGFSAPPEGARLKVRIGAGQKGPQVTEVIEVDLTSAVPPRRPSSAPPMRSGGGGSAGYVDESGPEVAGAVRWFDPEKGFGFIKPDVGEKDLFVHISAVERSGLGNLAEGQRVVARVGQGKKGPEARSLRLE